jgi:myo-inositol-1(or 4)-monophosphatase
MSDLNLQEIHDLLVKVAHQAGQKILAANPRTLGSDTKLNCMLPLPPLMILHSHFLAADLVTETDKAVETMVSTELMGKYPNFEFIGEETYKPGMVLTDAPTFIVDPIDGTTNFVHGFNSVCISLGLAVKKVATIGVIYNPFLDELYTAISGQGAYLTTGRNAGVKQKLPLKKNPEPFKDLSSTLVATEWGSDRRGNNFDLKVKVFSKLGAAKEDGGAMVHSMRSMGSAALNLSAVAAGQLDMYWEAGCWAWDVCAGWCILIEAGGIMVSTDAGDWEPTIEGRKYFAVRGAPRGQKDIVEEFWKVVGDGKFDYSS